jgi:hypothetical protein
MAHPPNNLSQLKTLLSPPIGPDEIGRLGDFPIFAFSGDGGMGFVCRTQDAQGRKLAL